eukprot:TRINITY_DN5726_c0_g1_i2.p1 TRINITY_DN5726_c0_g1~~TRINITY_DN5726_c0_g1_i2.p1  ORF type:complete len:143 (+),score=40.34 TRINITY_DN5726_c0_g1_i2:111-539(+)
MSVLRQATSILSRSARSHIRSTLAAARQASNYTMVVGQNDFEDKVIKSDKPVIVDFTASWCGPCKMLFPILEKVVDSHEGNVLLAKIDIDENQELAQAFQVSSVPYVVGIKDGKPITGFMGAHPEAKVKEFVQDVIDGKASQ